MPPREIARQIRGTFRKEPFQVWRMIGDFHKRQRETYFPLTCRETMKRFTAPRRFLPLSCFDRLERRLASNCA
jgi:hypothetical protein